MRRRSRALKGGSSLPRMTLIMFQRSSLASPIREIATS